MFLRKHGILVELFTNFVSKIVHYRVQYFNTGGHFWMEF